MNRPLLAFGLILLAFGLTAGVFAFATHDRWDDHRTIEYHISGDTTADGGDGGRVLVVEGDHRWGPGFFPLFPLLFLGGIVTAFALAGRGRRHGGPRHWDARDRFDDWHRTAHTVPGTGPSTTPPPGDTAPREQ